MILIMSSGLAFNFTQLYINNTINNHKNKIAYLNSPVMQESNGIVTGLNFLLQHHVNDTLLKNLSSTQRP